MSGYEDLRRYLQFGPVTKRLECAHMTSPFRASWSETVGELATELRMHGAQAAVMELDFKPEDFRLDGLPRSNRTAQSPGVVLSFKATRVHGSPQLRYEAVRYRTWQDNVRAVALGLEALRKVDRYGITKLGEQYTGFRALESGDVARGRDIIREWGSVAEALKRTHPDHGGAREDFDAVMAAKGSAVAL